ncbi:MAG: phosphate ABC transporter substrate-binding protein [Saprospiraceae bacterium]|nr:phosphate ABC transporter substrate-binding protein [Lewinella sp.]
MRRLWLSLIPLLFASCFGREVETLVIRGSDTEVNLVLQLAENYMDTHSGVSIAVTGGGSGTGIAALLNKKTDIANSSRSFKDSELQLAAERKLEVVPIIFALDALSFIVNENLPIEQLSIEQLRGIYTGEISNWSEVGGPDQTISLYGRQSNSGTFTFIQTHILKGNYSPDMKQMNGTAQIIEGIKRDKAGIGYVGIGYIVNSEGQVTEGIKVLCIQGEGQSWAVSPLEPANITNGSYQIVRPLYQYLDGAPEGIRKAFLQYELSPEGQKIISENGYYAINDTYRKKNEKYLESK